MDRVVVVVPNWNGDPFLKDCLESLLAQTIPAKIVVVDNGSTDTSLDILRNYGDSIYVIKRDKNYGFTGGVNPGLQHAIESGFTYVALFNNDAVADKNWLKSLVNTADSHPEIGIVTPRILNIDGSKIDSTGDFYTIWGLPYPRGRDMPSKGNYTTSEEVFSASGGASLYRVEMLKKIGLFDQDFFAYLEDVDISFRAQILGWRIYYNAKAVVYHRINATSGRHKGFSLYHTLKNMPFVYVKNMPGSLFWKHLPKISLVHLGLVLGAIKRGNGSYAIRAYLMSLLLMPKKLFQRVSIQKNRVASISYIESIIQSDPPQNQTGVLRLKKFFRA